jgi:hypothetical protein
MIGVVDKAEQCFTFKMSLISICIDDPFVAHLSVVEAIPDRPCSDTLFLLQQEVCLP